MTKGSYAVKVSAQAYYALDAHMAFLSRVKSEAAEKTRERVMEKIFSLRGNPYLYPVFEADADFPEYRKLLIGRYLILYVVVEESKTVEVDLIWDTRRDNVL